MDSISKYFTILMVLEDILLLIMDTISKYYTKVTGGYSAPDNGYYQ